MPEFLTEYTILAECQAGHSTTLHVTQPSRAACEMFCGLLDGTSSAYVFPPGPESVIGKCCYPNCGKNFTARIVAESASE